MWSVCLWVCLFVCLHISKTTRPNFITCYLWLWLWWQCDTSGTASLVDSVMFSHNAGNKPESMMIQCLLSLYSRTFCCVIWFARPPYIVNFSHRTDMCICCFSLLANVNVLRNVCYMLSAVRLSSVCLSSVTLVHPTQAVELFGNFFHHSIAQGLGS